MKSKYSLKKEREKLFQIVLKEKPTAGRVYRIVRRQDRGFITMLKENLKQGVIHQLVNTPTEIAKEQIDHIIDELTGEKEQ